VQAPPLVPTQLATRQLLTLVAFVGAIGLARPPAVEAQGRVVVIRATEGVADADAQRLDAVLLAEVTRTTGLGVPTLATLELSDVELAVGCSGTAPTCLQAIAGMLEASGLVLRRMRSTPDGLVLALTWFDPSSGDAPTTIEAVAPDALRLAGALPREVRRLFGVPEPVVAAVEEPVMEPAPRVRPAPGVILEVERPGAPVLPLVVASTGAAVLAVGVVFGLLSADAQNTYATTPVRTPAEADDALAAFDEARSRALVANVLYGVGGGLLLVGASWLVVELMVGRGPSAEPGSPRASVGIAPLPGGVVFALQGAF